MNALAPYFDVIIIDSWSKIPGADLDSFRKAHHGKFVLTTYQLNQDGTMRGGSRAQFDTDMVAKVAKSDDYRTNYVYWDKSRCQDQPGIMYNIFNRALVVQGAISEG